MQEDISHGLTVLNHVSCILFKGRIQRFEALRDKKGPVEDGKVEMESISSRLGRTTIEITDLCKSYGDKVLIKDYTYFFLKDDRIGYIGPNGSGKSTLMKMIAGWIKPDSGTIEIGQTVKLGYFSQENEDMDTSLKVIDYIKSTGLNYYVGPFETTIEGDYDQLMDIVKECQHIAVRAGAPSVAAYIKVSYHPEGDVLTIEKKVTKHHQ